MQKVNQKAARVFDTLTKGMEKVGDHKKIINEPFMPLCIEVIDKQGPNGLRISFCHYGEQNGDLMRDPEICFIKVQGINGAGMYAPYYFRNDYQGVEQFAVNFGDNGAMISYYAKQQRDIATFAGIWAENLKNQGFIKADEAQKKPTKEIPLSEMMEPMKGPLIEAGLLREESDGSFTAPLPALELDYAKMDYLNCFDCSNIALKHPGSDNGECSEPKGGCKKLLTMLEA